MKIFTEKRDDLLLLRFEGQLDAVATAESEEKLLALLDASPLDSPRSDSDKVQVVVDLSPLTYLSSAGLRVLLRLTKKVMDSEGRIVFHSPQPRVRQILDIAGLSMMLAIYDAEAEAIAALSTEEPLPSRHQEGR